jgi:alanyl-tRNA synthetase
VPLSLREYPPTEVGYYEDPYTVDFRARVLWSDRDLVLLDRTYFYPTGGGQITDTGHLGELAVVEVLREGPHVLHRLERPSPFTAGEAVRGRIDAPRRRQLMQHHTATHLLNGALREVLGPHVWQAGAFKSPELARIDITHFRALSLDELAQVDRRVNAVIRENRPVRSYFESRGEAERRFGFTLYQGGSVPGKRLRIVEIEGFDVEACGGTHCTRTGEVGFVTILGTERIADGVVRLTYAAGDRAIEVKQQNERTLHELGARLGVAPGELVPRVDRLLAELKTKEKAARTLVGADLDVLARQIEQDPASSAEWGGIRCSARRVELPMREMQELCRKLTNGPGKVALLVSEASGTGFAIVGSTAPAVPAAEVLSEMLPEFGGKGGGNASVATGSGQVGAGLDRALAKGRAAVERRAAGPAPSG